MYISSIHDRPHKVEVLRYSILRRDRHGSGVCTYSRSDILFTPRIDFQTDNVETVWVEILLPKTRPILTGICYRPPTFDLLELSFNECILLGDLIPTYCCRQTMSSQCSASF